MAEPEEEDHSYIRTAVTLGAADMISDWLSVETNQCNKALVTNMVLVPAAMYGQLAVLETALRYGKLEYWEKALIMISLKSMKNTTPK